MDTPTITYPAELPVSAAREEIMRAIYENQVVIIAGATGSGKTTQIPKMCLDLGRKTIAHTQPRRLAARTIAERIAEEVHTPVGDVVGYQVRFTDRVSAATRIVLMTDGILLNEIHRDRLLRRYDTIIIDEAHERSLNVDFLLGYLRRILPERPDLKVIVTSATIDPQSFAAHFAQGDSPAPVIEVSGRTYPVEIRYRPRLDTEPADDEPAAIVAALRELEQESRGDVLVFLPGEAEIRDVADAVRGAYARDTAPTEVLPLYGRLSSAEQHRVFEPSRIAGLKRRVVLATNVAETSLTVPGIRYVIDTGTARISRYSTRSKVQQLPIEAVSQASANQRSGRGGRTSDGIAIRLYAEDDFEKRAEFTEPEILRTSLASVVLQMLTLGFGDISSFPFMTPPDSRGVRAAFDQLTELGAVSVTGESPRLTRVGRSMSRMPVDPRFARMLIEAERTGVTREVLAIVAGLSIQDVRERPEDHREDADRQHARFSDQTSDFMSLLNLWDYLREKSSELGSSAFRRLCRQEYLNYVRVREWFDVHRQLRSLTRTRKDEPTSTNPDTVHKALLSGLLSQIGVRVNPTKSATRPGEKSPRSDRNRPAVYAGARGIRFSLFPGSALRKKAPAALMAAEIVETSRLFARTAAAIDLAWAEPLAGALVNRQISEPRWSKDAGAAVATEKVTLFGVDIVPKRRVQFARIDQPGARELFVRHALVDGEWNPGKLDTRVTAFWRSNTELRRRLERREERERRRDLLMGDEAVFAFYNRRIPADVFDIRSFESWWRHARTDTPQLLTMSESDLLSDSTVGADGGFPSRWTQGDQVLTLGYRFEPGAAEDGVSAIIPLALLAQVRPDGFDWQVPGMRAELITALLRALPKHIRRHVVPAADWAERFGSEVAAAAPELHNGNPPSTLTEALARRIQPLANQSVTATDFDLSRVPPHLIIGFRAVDERGRTAGYSRNLIELQRSLAERSRTSVSRSIDRVESRNTAPTVFRDGITNWDFGDLAEVIDTRVAGGVVRGYPALIDEGKTVSLQVESSPEVAHESTRRGVLRLLLLNLPSPGSHIQNHLTGNEKLALAASPYPNVAALVEDCRVAVVDAGLGAHSVRTREAFATLRDAISERVVDELFACVSLIAQILGRAREVDRGIRSLNSLTLLGPLGDIRSQLAGLIFPGFVSAAGVTNLAHYPRYLQGIQERLRTLAESPGKDRARMTEFERAAAAYADAGGTIPLPLDAKLSLVQARWMLEEYRVSVFAQRLGTAGQVSPQRILKVLQGS